MPAAISAQVSKFCFHRAIPGIKLKHHVITQSMQCSFVGCYQANRPRSKFSCSPSSTATSPPSTQHSLIHLDTQGMLTALSRPMKSPSCNLQCQHRKTILTGRSIAMKTTTKLPLTKLWTPYFPAKSYISDTLLFFAILLGQTAGMGYAITVFVLR